MLDTRYVDFFLQFTLIPDSNIQISNNRIWILHRIFFLTATEPLTHTTIENASSFPTNQSNQSVAFSALISQQRLLELSRFGMRGYDLAQQMLTQQGAVSKLLGN